MEREILLAQLKAFQIYLQNHIEDLKSRHPVELDENGELPVAEHNANSFETDHIDNRYHKLKDTLEQQYPDIFYNNLEHNFNEGIRGLLFMQREVGFILDTIANLDSDISNQPANQPNLKSNNQPFTKDEVQIIDDQLDDLQSKLLEILKNQNLSQEKVVPLIEVVKEEISDLKAEAANTKLGRRDWKNHLINTMITLTFTLSYSQEARTTIFTYFQSLFIYLYQHLLLLKQ